MAKPFPHPLSLFPISACSQRKMGPGTLPGAPRALTWGGAGAPKASGMAGDPERTCQNPVWSRSSTPPAPARQGLRLITPQTLPSAPLVCGYRFPGLTSISSSLMISPMDSAQTAQVWGGDLSGAGPSGGGS